MNCNEINRLMDDYLDNLLAPKIKKEFEESLEYCEEQKKLLAKFKQLEKRLLELPLSFNPPERIFEDLKNNLLEIDDPDREKDSLTEQAIKLAETKHSDSKSDYPKSGKRFKTSRKKSQLTNFLIISAIIVLIGLIGGYYFLYIFNNTSPWKFNLLGGSATVNQQVVERTNLYEGDNIILQDNSQAKIALPGEFEIELLSNSKIAVLDTRSTLNQIHVIDGSILFNTLSRESNFVVKLGSISISELAGKYRLITNNFGSVNLFVELGTIEISSPLGTFRVANDYSLTITENNRITIPVHKNASLKFRSEIDRLNTTVNDVAALSSLMVESKQTDALTLLRILELVTSEKRALLFQKVSNIFPPPSGVTRTGIIDGNKRMLEKWWSEIESQI